MTYEERRTDVCEACPKHANCTYAECRRTDLCLDLDNIMRGWELGQQDAKEQMMKGLCFETKVYLESDGCAEDFNESEWLDLENTEITDLPVEALGLKAGDANGRKGIG